MIRIALAGARHNLQVFAGLLISIALSVGVLYLTTTVFIEVPRAPASAATVQQVTSQMPADSVIVRMSTRPRFPGTDVAWTACDRPLPGKVTERVSSIAGAERVELTGPVLCSPANPDTQNTLVITAAAGDVDVVAARVRVALVDVDGIDVRPGSAIVDQAIHAASAQTADWILSAFSGFGVLLPVAAVFVVAGTASFSVAARRRDTALMRLSGASSAQAGLLVVLESLVIAAVGGVLGVALGVVVAGAYLDQVLAYFAPNPPHIGFSLIGSVAAFVGGLLIAAVGSVAAAWRATQVRPIAVLRDGSDARASWPWPRLAGLGIAVVFLVLTASPLTTDAGGGLISIGFMAMIAAVVVVVASAPWIAPSIGHLTGWMFRRSTSAGLLLASQGVDADRRRLSSLTASLGLAIGLAASLFTLIPTAAAISMNATAAASRFDTVLTPTGPATDLTGLPDGAITLRNRTLTSPASWALDNTVSVASTDLPRLPDFVDVQTAHKGLRPDEMLVSEFGASLLRADVGSVVVLGLPDGTTATLTVAGTYQDAAPLPQAVVDDSVTSGHVMNTVPNIWVQGSLADIPPGFTAQTTDAWLRATVGAVSNTTDMFVMIGIPVGLALLAAVNMLLMSAPGRRREFATLRRLGSGSALSLSLVIEGLMLTVLGAIAGIIAAALIALPLAVNEFSDGVQIQLVPVVGLLALAALLVSATNASLAARRTTERA